jgi:molecular chaperone GrpE
MTEPSKQDSGGGNRGPKSGHRQADPVARVKVPQVPQVPQDPDPDATITLSEVEKLQLELADTNKRALLAQADLDNYRKRVERERQQEGRYASIRLLRDLLPVLDNVQRAIEAAEKTDESTSLREGFKLVAQQLQTTLTQHDCQPISAVGEVFDPNLHEAVSQLPSEEYPAGKILFETAVGYLLHDRVVRPSQVVVSTGSSKQAD